MKNSEEAIDKVLAGLRDAEAPVGMERRILDGVEERAAARTRLGWWPRQRVAVGYLVALAGVLVIVLAVPAIRRAGHGSSRPGAGAALVTPAAGATAEVAAGDAGTSSPGAGGRLMGVAKVHAARPVPVSDSRVEDSEESVAWSEMHAASFPAPPMPLTEQEKLLLRIAHKGDPVEMAMLDPKMRAARDAEDKAEVQRFFVQPKMVVAPEQAANPVTEEEQRQGQPQIPSGDDTQKDKDNSNNNDRSRSLRDDNQKDNSKDNGNGNKSAVPEEPKAEPPVPTPTTTEQAVPQQTTTGENR